MKIRQLEIHNFRGIKSLDWKLPAEQRLVTLVGPGDSGKSTVLEAIHYLLGDRWNIAFSDVDFFGTDVESPISIRAVLIDVPAALRKDTAFGLWLSGLDGDGELHQDPEDQYTPALIAQLTVDSSLEPKWTVERVDGQSQSLNASQRRSFSTFKVDDRTDAQLRWSRTSALGRMSSEDGGEREALAAASRAARDALADHQNSSLADLAEKVQERANRIGGGRFAAIKPGLDTSRSSMGAALALYEDVVPLTSFGLGSRRLASFAVQQLAAGTRSVAVVDEIESGLEPHRAVRLLEYLLTDDDYSQVVVTTHSPIIVEQARIENLATVQNSKGIVTVTSLGGSSERLQKLRRSRPSSFLARRVVVTEGATEYGVLLSCVDVWDQERSSTGLSTAAGEGAAIQDGQGGTEVPLRAQAMAKLGYEAAGFMDNDVRDSDAAVTDAELAGVTIIRWDLGHQTESQLCAELDSDGLTSLLTLAVDRRNSEDTVLQDLNFIDPSRTVSSLDVGAWLEIPMTLDDARSRIASAAVARKWFKDVEGGKALGVWIMKHIDRPELARVSACLQAVQNFVYPAPPSLPSPEARVDEPTDG